jgi:hypothetical protein
VDFVNRNSKLYNVEWDPDFSEPLKIDPFTESYYGKKDVAHYFLLVASITESRLVGRAENARAILTYLQTVLEDELFKVFNKDAFVGILEKFDFCPDLGPENNLIPGVLVSVNDFVHNIARNDLVSYAKRFAYPAQMVADIGLNVERMNGQFARKSWMYMDWMTRPYPSLGVFSNFSPSDLLVPATSYIRAVASCLSLFDNEESEQLQNVEQPDQASIEVTSFAKELFPDDPCKVSYPFYLLGCWILGKKPSLKLLERYLRFFEEIFEETHTIPVNYDVASREMSKFEENVKSELKKTNIMFSYESHKFHLRDGLTYLPDFVLSNCRVKGKTVLLEPHGVWTHPLYRTVNVGGKKISCYALPPKLDESEIRFTEKMRMFREMYGQEFYLDLLVPDQVYDRVRADYPHSYDEIYVGTDIPKLLYDLKSC